MAALSEFMHRILLVTPLQARWVTLLSEAARLMHRELNSPASLLRQLVGAAALLAPARHVMCWQWAADATLERAASLAEGGNSVQGHGAELRACALRCARRQTITRSWLGRDETNTVNVDVDGSEPLEVLSVPLLHGAHASSTLAVLQVVAPRNPLGRLHAPVASALAALAALGAVGLEHCLVHVRTAAIMRDCLRISGESTLELGMHITAATITTACARALEAQRSVLWLCR